MTTLASGPDTTSNRKARPPLLPYGWPFTAMFAGLGFWWALGFSGLAPIVFAVPMAAHLVAQRPLRLPRGFGIWLIFLLWGGFSVVTLGVDPPGTLPGSFASGLLPYIYRLVCYLSATIVVVYVATLDPRRYSQDRVSSIMGLGFIWVALGGLLGMLAPEFEFTSPVEMLLPQALQANSFVQSMVHPSSAQVQDFLGYDTARPSAPFGYTNMWGHMFALLLPWFVVTFVARARGWRRITGTVFALVAIIPVITSLNRGLWVGVGLCAVYLAVRLITHKKFGAVFVTVLAMGVIGLLLAASPLFTLVQERFDGGHSDKARTYTATRTIDVTAASPIIGLGSTRTDRGGHASIAIGASPDCRLCGNMTIGINGQLWTELVAHGFVGATLYICLFCYLSWRFRKPSSPESASAHLCILLMLWFMFIYPALPNPLSTAFGGWGLLWREESLEAGR